MPLLLRYLTAVSTLAIAFALTGCAATRASTQAPASPEPSAQPPIASPTPSPADALVYLICTHGPGGCGIAGENADATRPQDLDLVRAYLACLRLYPKDSSAEVEDVCATTRLRVKVLYVENYAGPMVSIEDGNPTGMQVPADQPIAHVETATATPVPEPPPPGAPLNTFDLTNILEQNTLGAPTYTPHTRSGMLCTQIGTQPTGFDELTSAQRAALHDAGILTTAGSPTELGKAFIKTAPDHSAWACFGQYALSTVLVSSQDVTSSAQNSLSTPLPIILKRYRVTLNQTQTAAWASTQEVLDAFPPIAWLHANSGRSALYTCDLAAPDDC